MNIVKYRETLHYIHHSSLTDHGISRYVGLSPHTVKRCRLKSEKHKWRWLDIQALDDRELTLFFYQKRKEDDDKVMPDFNDVHKMMQTKHQTRVQIWSEYKAELKEKGYSYSQFNHYYQKYLNNIDCSLRLEHYAGEIQQCDFAGKRIPWKNTKTRSDHYAHVFISILPCSDYTFAYAVEDQKLHNWIEANVQSLNFIGGVPQSIVPDNLKAAVDAAGIFPVINKTFQELSEHYSTVVLPARAYKPKDKAKVENAVLHITRWIIVPLCRRQFFSIDEINEAIAVELDKFNRRPFKNIPGNRLDRFLEIDKPALKPLPQRPYEYAEWKCNLKVGTDYHVFVKKHAYSVPYHLVGEKVDVRIGAKSVGFYYLNKQVASHPRNDTAGDASTIPNHRPKGHQAYASQNMESFVQWAESVGVFSVQVIKFQFENRPGHSFIGRKACAQLKSLAKTYGNERFEAACSRATDITSPTVKSVRSILQHCLDQVDMKNTSKKSCIPQHKNIRGASYYE